MRARTEMLRQAMEDLEHSYDVTLEALGDALDLKDSETEGHSKRVTAYTIALARAMGISPAEIKVIARGAFLHDIGKMAIPDEILRKPGKLTPEEQEVMREHCSARLPHAAQDSVSLPKRRRLSSPTRSTTTAAAIPAGCAAARFPSARASSPSPTRWTPSPATGPTARRAASMWPAKRFCAAPEHSSIPPSSRSFSRFPTSFGTSCARRSPARTSGSRPSSSPALPARRDSEASA